MRIPNGHSLEAIRILQKRFNKEEMYLICRLNKYKGDRLLPECVVLDILRRRCKSWKSYTLPYYDRNLKELVKPVTMETLKMQNFASCFLNSLMK